jgi:hypothetical protein
MKTLFKLAFILASLLFGQQQQSADHQTGVNSRGEHVMGFSHDKTTHHFRLFADGGVIEVTANDLKDTESRDQIRMHLSHIARMFVEGNFQAPMLIHDRVPPGVPTLQRLKAQVSYSYEDIDGGGKVRIMSKNEEALSAVHDFLKFQIEDHQTGDSKEITKETVAPKR